MKLKGKLILSLLLAALVPVIAISFITFFGFSGVFLGDALSDEQHDVMMKRDNIYTFLGEAENDALFLSRLSSLEDLINAKTPTAYALAKDNVEGDFLSFSKQKYIYYQVRYLDENGQEVVRIDHDGEEAKLIPESKLQNKFSRYYFQDALKIEVGEVLISPLDLNIERGEVENRGTDINPEYVPVLRYYTPVSDKDGNNRGVVVTNIYADYFLSQLHMIFTGVSGKEMFLLNDDGYYLHHPEEEKEWSFMFADKDFKATEDHCGDVEGILLDDSGQALSKKGDCYCTYLRVYPNKWLGFTDPSYFKGLNRDDFWVVVSKVERNGIFAEMYSTFINVLISAFLIVLLVIVLIILLFRLIFIPIKKLTQGVKIIGQGNFDYQVKLKNKDEIGDLAKEFNKMARSVKKSRADIEAKVEKRTSELEKLNKVMVGRELKMIEMKKQIKDKK